MDVIEYLKTEERICGFYTEGCQECPLSSYNNGAGTECSGFIKQEPEKCIEIMKKWTEEHPRKTAEFKPKEPELKACPFCGGEAAVTGRWREYAIECVECYTMTTYYKTPEEAVEAWNRRAEEHSVRTRQSEFLKMFPNASLDSNGSVDICPKATDLATFSCDDGAHGGCLRCRQRYWQQEVKDEPLD